jgi:hypothetical protein
VHIMLNKGLGVACPPPCLTAPRGTNISGKYKSRHDRWTFGVYRKASLHRLCELLEPHLRHAKRRTDMYAVWANVIERGVKM